MRQQRRVGGDDDDDRTLAFVLLVVPVGACGWRGVAARARRADGGVVRRDAGKEIRDFLADRHSGDTQLAPRAAVALDEHTHGVPAVACIQLARRRADAALEAVTDHARSAADIPLERHDAWFGAL